MSTKSEAQRGEPVAAATGEALSLCRDCWDCECAVPVAWIREGTAIPCEVPIECPYCGAIDPLGNPPQRQPLIATPNAKSGAPLAEASSSALHRIEVRVGDLGDSEAAQCIRELCRELRHCRAALDRIRSFQVVRLDAVAYAMQDIAHEALSSNPKLRHDAK